MPSLQELGAVIMALVALITALETRRKTQADATARTTEILLTMVTPLETRVKCLEEEAQRFRERIRILEDANESLSTQGNILTADNKRLKEASQRLEEGVAILIDQIKRLGHKPDWEGIP